MSGTRGETNHRCGRKMGACSSLFSKHVSIVWSLFVKRAPAVVGVTWPPPSLPPPSGGASFFFFLRISQKLGRRSKMWNMNFVENVTSFTKTTEFVWLRLFMRKICLIKGGWMGDFRGRYCLNDFYYLLCYRGHRLSLHYRRDRNFLQRLLLLLEKYGRFFPEGERESAWENS